ncbi:cofactor-independent phosphoglycerate mutase [Candidatus Woesearchaeota archaeon]|nr:cofactor-independent phosphoglycerate mutase [Candidatus Woesearchaeota archaeon]
MKYIIFLMDGAADQPIDELGGKTPLMAVNKPNIDALAKKGRCGLLETVPKDMEAESAIANLSILGYDLKKCYQGRAVLEAANMGVKLDNDDTALRCNLITVKDGKIKDYSSGHISDKEARELIEHVNKKLGNDETIFYPGISYRHLLVLKGGRFSTAIRCYPPHDHPEEEIDRLMIKAESTDGEETAKLLNELILDSRPLLEKHPVNTKRSEEGKNPGNIIWPWSPGKKPSMETFQELYGIKGAVISAVDLIKGLGIYAGFDVIDVEGATGLWDTNYEGKADACVKALEEHDLVYVHLEGIDEASHIGDLKLKLKAIEDFDKRLVGRVLEKIKDDVVCIAVLPDHLTPIKLKSHLHGDVPFLIYKPGEKGDDVKEFDEESCKKGSYGHIRGKEFISNLLK